MARRSGTVLRTAVTAALVLGTNAQVPTATATAVVTTLATSRYVIDHWNLTFSLHSDEFLGVSAGSADIYGDKIGWVGGGLVSLSRVTPNCVCLFVPSTARSTAVMFHTPVGNGLPYMPLRCDIMLYKLGGQTRNLITDFFLTLYSDDGSEVGNPGVQVRHAITLF